MSVIFLCTPLCSALISWTIISVSHMIIDKIRIIYDRNKEHEKKKLKSLLIDQLLHLCFIFGCYMGFMRFNSGFIHHQLYVLPWFTTVLVYISILSIIMKPTAVLVSCVFESCFHASVKKDESKMDPGAGRWIGVLERVIVAVLVLLNAIDLKRYIVFSVICYIAMGWCILGAYRAYDFLKERGGIGLLFWGGVAYTVGVIFYGLQKKYKYMHSVFHLLTLLGSILQFFCIILYVITNILVFLFSLVR